jgi:CcmD family protein
LTNLGFLLAAFIIVWLVLFGYVWFVARRQVRLNREIALLRDELDRQTTE